MTTPTPPSGSGIGPATVILSALGLVADVSAVVGLMVTGSRLVPVIVIVSVGVAGLIGLCYRRFRPVGAVVLVISLVSGGVLGYRAGQGGDGVDTAGPRPSTSSQSSPTNTATPTTSTFTPSSAAKPAESWFDLTGYQSITGRNGHSSVGSITIGTGAESDTYPNSIKGYYSSSAAVPDNQRTWLTAGKCTQLSVWVGKDAASTKAAGTGRFIVKAEEAEVDARDAVMGDNPQHMEVDITGVVRLTLFDTRGRDDANNAWGDPRVLCTTAPGKAR